MSKGKIMVVGLGPGSKEQMTARAREAIRDAQVIIGYSTYVKLIADLLEDQEVIKKGMTEETDRCVLAMKKAQQGKKVALISSGDAGIYGMATLTYEVLLQAGWKPGSDIEVEVIPGTTALAACGSLVGAPLGHDFCAISLSDLLTPWPVISRRLEAAAQADFVVALYNPKSGRRTGQIVAARDILLRHRRPDTPIAIVKSAYRPKQSIQLSTLENMVACDIGMLSTVLIGNSDTFIQEGLMITPRGYAGKYANLVGEAVDGEKAGRSLSLGFEGWHDVVREWFFGHDNLPCLEDAAREFNQPIGEILPALVEQDDENRRSAQCRSQPLNTSQLDDILDTVMQSAPLVARVTTGNATMRCQASQLTTHAATILIKGNDSQVELEVDQVKNIWWMTHPHGEQLVLLDITGNPLLFLHLTEKFDITPFALTI